MNDLKPCPFCGDKPELEIGEIDLNGSATQDSFQYYCDNCDFFRGEFNSVESATSDWNKRAQPTIADYLEDNKEMIEKTKCKVVTIESLKRFGGL